MKELLEKILSEVLDELIMIVKLDNVSFSVSQAISDRIYSLASEIAIKNKCTFSSDEFASVMSDFFFVRNMKPDSFSVSSYDNLLFLNSRIVGEYDTVEGAAKAVDELRGIVKKTIDVLKSDNIISELFDFNDYICSVKNKLESDVRSVVLKYIGGE